MIELARLKSTELGLSVEFSREVQRVSSIRIMRRNGRIKPQRPCLLLAVLDFFEAKVLKQNSIEFDSTPRLVETFKAHFTAVSIEGEDMSAGMPFDALLSDKNHSGTSNLYTVERKK